MNDAFNGGRIYLWNGQGSSNHRKVKDTLTANSEIQTGSNFDYAPAAGTEYAVLDVDSFAELTGFGAGKQISDVLAVNGAIYWACGNSTVIRRLRYYLSGGVYPQFADEGAAGFFLKAVTDAGQTTIWKALRTLPAQVTRAGSVDCTGTGAAAALSWSSSPINVGDVGIKITGMQVHGEDFPRMMVMKEDGVYEMIGDTAYEKRIAGLREMRDGWTGIASGVVGVYLFWNVGDLILRYYRGQVDNKSPMVPVERKGRPNAMVTYGDRLYVAMDGGDGNYSSIVCYTGTGWHEIYRAPSVGLRILNLCVQPIPGVHNADRLWFSCGSDVCWVPLALDPATFNNMIWTATGQYKSLYHFYAFAPNGYMDGGAVYLGRRFIQKLFNAARVVLEDSSAGSQAAKIWYRIDGGTWTLLDNWAGGAMTELELSSAHDKVGYSIQLRLEARSSGYKTPVVKALVLEALAVEPTKYTYTLTFRAEDQEPTLLGHVPDSLGAAAKLAQLRAWAATASGVLMNSVDPELDGKYVKVDPVTPRVIEVLEVEKRRTYVCQLQLYEVG